MQPRLLHFESNVFLASFFFWVVDSVHEAKQEVFGFLFLLLLVVFGYQVACKREEEKDKKEFHSLDFPLK